MSDSPASAPPVAGQAPGAPVTPAATEAKKGGEPISRYGWHALILMSSAQMMSLLDRQILSILANDIRLDLGIGDAEMGLLYGTVFALFYALFSLPLGRLVDGWVRTKLLAICLAGWSFFAGLAAFAQGFTLLAISRLGVGIGEAATQPAANSILFDSLPKSRRGLAMGGLGVGLALGLGLSMALGGIVAERWDLAFASGDAPFGFRGWQVAFLVAALPGFPLAWLIYKLREPERGTMDGIHTKADPAPFAASAGVLGAVTPGANWMNLWRRDAGARQWAINLVGLGIIIGFCLLMVELTSDYSPRPALDFGAVAFSPHVLQWSVFGFGAFVVLNLFQNFRLTDKPTFNVVLSPSLLMLMVVGGLQTAINYGVMFASPQILIRQFGLSMADVGLQFGLLSALLATIGALVAGPLADWLGSRMGPRGMIWLVVGSLGISPFFGIWTYSAETLTDFYIRYTMYSLILTLWLPPTYTLLLGLALPRMRGIVFSTYLVIMTLLGQGLGPYFVGIISDQNGGDLAQALITLNLVCPAIVALLLVVLTRYARDEESMLDRARAGGEEV
ncbi:MFS transporter [Aurantiacibacter poecillastricola]|uniref:MFS transporter n=1 Tax=Aurantiacibacter poecillastricola TaxID=3064385 RepID=UPI0027402CE7|nr:MFS transporter [Aurantiacibacter sp. 219JJ12-13]MDP5260141.1 MFS transporter [Aurantiacibacter sp. 219JJ12-13]